ncbi:MAG: hypothetical protein QNJ91_09420 [Gammaproteobacteria bacterium]|nr:hypothetical protein [Gammaproteobacteria bacterium]
MLALTDTANDLAPFDNQEPAALECGLACLVKAYQANRCRLHAWQVVRCAEALSRHPAFEGGDEQRCVYGRLARQWRWLATAGGRGPAGEGVA